MRTGSLHVSSLFTGLQDVNGDGKLDMLALFALSDVAAALSRNTQTVEIVALSMSGTGQPTFIRGTDSVRIVSPHKHKSDRDYLWEFSPWSDDVQLDVLRKLLN